MDNNERKAVNPDQRLKSLIMSVLLDDQMNSVINCVTTKSTWEDMILYHEGPSDVKENRVMDRKLCYNTFRFKESENLTQTFTSDKAVMNELENMSIGAKSHRNRRVQGENAQGRTKEVVEIDIETLTMEQYLGVVRNNRMTRVMRPEIRGNRISAILDKKGMKCYTKPGKGLEIPTRRMLDSRGPILGMIATRAFVAIQAMASHSQKLHDKGGDRGLERSSSDGMNAIINKFSDLGQDMRKLKESVHSIQEIVVKTGERNETPKSTPVIGNFTDTLKRRIAEEQERMFLENLERVPVNIPLIDTIRKTPDYTKSLQELVSIKTRIEYLSMVKLNARCSVVLQNELPPKEKDPRSFIFPCVISNMTVSNALADLGASINVMPFYLFKCLGMGNPRPIRMLIEIADKSIVEPFEVLSDSESEIRIGLEDFSVNLEELLDEQALQFGQFKMLQFMVDFIVLEDVSELIENGLIEILLERPFKDSSGIEESVMEWMVWFKIGGDKTNFQMPKAISRFRHLSTKQCNMMTPILRISDEDKTNGFDRAHQKIKGFYKGCLELGDEYKKDEKVIDWITYTLLQKEGNENNIALAQFK
nr:hypothetical protein [Tanacetum cinerariifolium]